MIVDLKYGFEETIFLTDDKSSWVNVSWLSQNLSNNLLDRYEYIFSLHPEEIGKIINTAKNKEVQTTRYHQSYLSTPKYVPEKMPNFYMYSGYERTEDELPKDFQKILTFLREKDPMYNQVSVCWFPNGSSHVPQHTDCKVGMKDDSPISIVSLFGDLSHTRIFKVHALGRCNNALYKNLCINTKHGCILTLGGKLQEYFTHGIPKSKDDYSRISVSFRQIEN